MVAGTVNGIVPLDAPVVFFHASGLPLAMPVAYRPRRFWVLAISPQTSLQPATKVPPAATVGGLALTVTPVHAVTVSGAVASRPLKLSVNRRSS